jgi:hypothetical protein
VYVQEILPGDSFAVSMTAFCRLATPLFPIMDNCQLESFFFFVPNRLVWTHWVNFMGEQANPADSISFTIPQLVSPAGGFARFSYADYFGIPCAGQTAGGNTISVNALPFRAMNLIYNQWFRDENLQNSIVVQVDDGPDSVANYAGVAINKRHDYFTSCLPWTQKGGTAVTVPLAGNASIKTLATEGTFTSSQGMIMRRTSTGALMPVNLAMGTGGTLGLQSYGTTALAGPIDSVFPSNLWADLTTATGATINALRQSFQIQRLLERDARGGTRYTEIIRSHFGVLSPDMRLQRPEYLGGGKTAINIAPVPQTTATGLTGGTSPLGTLAGVGIGTGGGHGFRQSFTEHGYVLGLVAVRADMGYQQGIDKMWKRSTRYDFYFPVFQALGEQPVLNYEIYSDGSANDALTFGFQERWGEYRWKRSTATGYFNSKAATPLDAWHLIEKFAALPALNSAFVTDSTTANLQRALAAGAAAANQQVLADLFFDVKCARPMPMYSVPGMIDHF